MTIAADKPAWLPTFGNKRRAAFSGLRVAHRLLLIYLLSFASVAYLAYTLIAEKNISIEFSRKEMRGINYADVVRQVLMAIVRNRETVLIARPGGEDQSAALQEQMTALAAAEREFGDSMDTGALVNTLLTELGELVTRSDGDSPARRDLEAQAIATARELISKIGDESNLILDADLDSYYTMSVVMLRLPEAAAEAVGLAGEALALKLPRSADDESQVRFLLKDGAFSATIAGIRSDMAAAFRGNADRQLRSRLEPAFLRAESAVHDLSHTLRYMVTDRRSADANAAAVGVLLRQALGTMDELWRQADGELRRLLCHRIGSLYRRRTVDLGMATAVWLASLGLIFVVARQITTPIRDLSRVAQRIRHGEDYSLRARYRASGEVGELIDGFNTMLDRLQGEAAREQERVARDRAAMAQRHLIEAVPVVISVTSKLDERVLFANSVSPYLLPLPDDLLGDPRDILNLLYPEDRDVLVRQIQCYGHVDGFQARCQTPLGEPFWVLIGSRTVDYQGEPALLTVSTPINDRKRAEAALARRGAVLDAISYAATRIIGAADWRPAMPDLLSRLGTATDVCRVFLFEIHPAPEGDGQVQSCRFSWAAEGCLPIEGDPRYQNDPISAEAGSQFADWFERRSRGEVVQVTLSETEGDARRWFAETSTFSMLSVPILVDGVQWGSIGFDDCRSERVWDEMEIDLLKTAAALITSAIQRSRADDQIRQRDRRLIEAQRIGHVGSWELDLETNDVVWSDEGWRIFGLEPCRRSWPYDQNLQAIHPDDRRRVLELDNTLRVHGGSTEIEYRIRRPDGEVRIVHERAEAIRDAAGRPRSLIGTVHDVTELKAAEERLRASEERYKLAAQGADVGLFDWDVPTGSTYFSPRTHEILGVGPETLGGSIAGLLEQFSPEDRDALQSNLANRFAAQRRRFQHEARLHDTSPDARWIGMRGLIVYAEGHPVRLVGSLVDITDRKRSQEALIRQREALYQNEKMAMLGTLLAGVAHELNNPLSVVIGQIALLQETSRDATIVRRAERIRNAADRCARIVRTFLAMARQRQPEPRPTALGGIVDAAVDLLGFQLRAADIRLELTLAKDEPTVTVDADQMHQVVTNLIVNAQQALAASPGPRLLRIRTWFDGINRRACLSVSDNGPGVPAEMRSRIFDPFFTTKPAGEGTGIGLALCSSIVRSYGGEISVMDTPGGGATFTVELPLSSPLDVPEEDSGRDEARRDLRILVVDDEGEIAATLSEILDRRGFKTDVVFNGQEALDQIAMRDYDLVLSDFRMPLLDGPGLYRALAERHPHMVNRLAFITGDTLSSEARTFLRDARRPCLEKPFLPEDVLRLVAQVTEAGSPSERARSAQEANPNGIDHDGRWR
ncbi:MAG TPA: PAS domain-containing protein [Hypericibacter adhaerens]|uniref:PAS domain-containing protein n=1 Tax=Hypericibacter adhaerens TaxID=2602016 RepID=UPI002C3FD40A|nr:PAS domain-containing protein [Hypericibacter adhaerens]HWA43915.1 PAS domain-containing protein [Hypericibacter adhaerens]